MTTEGLDRLTADVDHADPGERLVQIARARADLDAVAAQLRTIRHATILELRDAGATWAEIGALLGVSAQRAEAIIATARL